MAMDTTALRLSSAEATDTGKKAQNNEDAVIRLPDRGVFGVADGMGGGACGQEASQMVVKSLAARMSGAGKPPGLDEAVHLGIRALNEASYRIRDLADERGLSSIGSTAVVLILDMTTPGRAAVLHAGDSRAYRLRNGKLDRITTDHSIASAVGISDDDALPPMLRGVITNAVGIKATVQVDTTAVDVLQNDLFLLCSDGLTRGMRDKALRDILARNPWGNLDDAARALIDAANAAGGEDNISVVLVRVDTCPAPQSDEPQDGEEPLTDMTSTVALSGSTEPAPTASDSSAPGPADKPG